MAGKDIRLIKGLAQVQKDELQVYLITDCQQIPRDRHYEVV